MKKQKRLINIGIIFSTILLCFLQACSFGGGNNPGANALIQANEQASSQTPIENSPMNTEKRGDHSIMNSSTKSSEKTLSPNTTNNTLINNSELFTYDSSKPFNVQESGVEETQTGVKIHELTYDAYDAAINSKGKISCYLVEPKGKGPFPFVLYLHWYGKHDSNKNEFLDEAAALADKGIGGLLIDGYFPWKELPSELNQDKALIVYQVVELRRAIDYMTSLPNVDQKRIGYVGHDYGALYGAVLSGIEKRISNYVFVAGMGNFSDWFLQYWVHLDKDGKQKYREEMKQLDPVTYIKNAAPAKIFFQFADSDIFLSKAVADEFYSAASQPKEVKLYDAAHEMNTDEVRLDRQKWLLDNLK